MFEPHPILVLDTETGGLSPNDHSLLSLAGIAWTPDRQPTPLFSFYVREPELKVTPEALELNRVSLDKVKEEGLSPKEAVDAIRYALEHHYGPSREKVMLCGHNIDFDKEFLRRLYRLSGEAFKDDFSGKTLDTLAIFQFFMACGLVPQGKASGDRMFASLGIPVPDAHRHTALGDAWATALSLSRMAQSVKRGRLPGPSPHSLHS